MPAPTLQQIAERARCSKATVSLALRNDPRIKEATRTRIRQLATAMGYHPNPALSSIAAQRWRGQNQPRESVAYINFRKYAKADPSSSLLTAAMAEQASQLGYHLEIFPWYEYDNLAQITRILRNRGVRGVVLGATTLEAHATQLAEFPWDRFCLVGCELGFHRQPIPIVMADHFSAARDLYRKAAEQGAESIAILMQTKGFSINDERTEAGFLYEHWKQQPKKPPDILHIPFGEIQLDTLIDWVETQQPAAVVANVAAAFPSILSHPSLALSKEKLFALSAGQSPATAFLHQPLKQIGALTSAMLAGRLNRNEYGKTTKAETILVPYEPGEQKHPQRTTSLL